MNRVTVANLEALVVRINRELGTNADAYSKGLDGRYHANVGAYHLDQAYGGYQLAQIVGEGGGTRDVLNSCHIPARELQGLMWAFLVGLAERDRVKP